jgi:dienelactone hydrolase
MNRERIYIPFLKLKYQITFQRRLCEEMFGRQQKKDNDYSPKLGHEYTIPFYRHRNYKLSPHSKILLGRSREQDLIFNLLDSILYLNKELRYMKKQLLLTLFILIVSTVHAQGGIIVKEIAYEAEGQKLIGYLAMPENAQDVPGILVVHEWTGLNAYAKKRAEDLAKEGFAAFALDMYGDGMEISISEARTMSRSIGSDFPLIQARFNAALEVLKSQVGVDPEKIAAIGYCFGGGIVLNMARMGTDIAGVVSFHGSLNTGLTAEPGDIQTSVLAIQGDEDPVAPLSAQNAFRDEMEKSAVDFRYIIYPNVRAHNFTNPAGSSYFEKEAEMAWNSMLQFFDNIF